MAPASAAVDGQLCIAIGPPRAQSRSQQQLVCLRGTHRDCPRFLHGVPAPASTRRAIPRAVPRGSLAALDPRPVGGISFGAVATIALRGHARVAGQGRWRPVRR